MAGSCPLCGRSVARPSWLGGIRYEAREYRYLECRHCQSLFCDPMPDDDTLAGMYGTAYRQGSDEVADPKDHDRVRMWLVDRSPGVFVDYGCGSGELLGAAAAAGWEAIGVELDGEVARGTQARTGVTVVTEPTRLGRGVADVLHLGDVIEHLTRMDEQMPEILRLLKPGACLIAQGPLEANPNLFLGLVRLVRRIKRARPIEMAPYHVSLATAMGQRQLFGRFGLHELEFRVTEVSWPAPERLGFADLWAPRRAVLFAGRCVSQWVSRLRPQQWGNRYFYVGRAESSMPLERQGSVTLGQRDLRARA